MVGRGIEPGRVMTSRPRTRGAVAALAILLAACSSPTADVSGAELRNVVERDAIVFEDAAIPAAVIDRLAEHKVVLLGETHHLREHWALVAALMSELHEAGFRQLLIEAPHMAGWLLDDYVQGSPLMPAWEAPPFYERRLSAIRALNETLSPEDRIHVHGIDANEEWYGGARDFTLLLGWVVDRLPTRGPVDTLLDFDYAEADASTQSEAIDTLLTSLEVDRSTLVAEWGTDRYDHLVEMLEIERSSVDVRALREDDDSDGARAREQMIKLLADERIQACSCGTVINIGGHHAQKSHLMGTDQEWMGDHLANTSRAVDGSIIVIGFTSARTELEPGADGTPWNILDSESPSNELRRVMAEAWPEQTVFLPLEDPMFRERTVAYNSEDMIHVAALQEQFDAIVQYGIANRMPVG